MQYEEILQMLRAQVHVNGHILGAVAGAGMIAKYTAMGGADFLLALSAGRYRVMGRGSYASYYCYGNSNEIVMELGKREILPILPDMPVLFGLFATDPFIDLPRYLQEIQQQGFSGIVNFPTLCLMDGNFRQALEEEGNTYVQEVEAIRLAHARKLFTVAFVTDVQQAEAMLEAGADVICVHLGLTKGGFMGAKKYISVDEARKFCSSIFSVCAARRPEALRMIYAGPANTPMDMKYIYQNTICQGYIGGSTFDRIPAEQALLHTTKAFKSYGKYEENTFILHLLEKNWHKGTFVDFIKQYIAEHYSEKIELRELALVLHISVSYLSTMFKKEVGCSFTEYLLRFRMNQAKDMLMHAPVSCKEAALKSGYRDYAQFSRMFHKYIGKSPREFAINRLHSIKKDKKSVNMNINTIK